MEVLARLVTNRICDSPLATSSSATYWTIGFLATVNISFGWDLVAGNNRVPKPATGTIALRITVNDYITRWSALDF